MAAGRKVLAILIVMAGVYVVDAVGEGHLGGDVYAQTSKQRRKTTSASKSSTQPSQSKTGTKAKRSGSAAGKQSSESSADVRRREQQTQKEIAETRAKIAENEKKVKSELAELGRIDADMAVTSAKVNTLSEKVNSLDAQISEISEKISKGRRELDRLRTQYLKAVKQMRLKRGNASALTFVFASENFNQALRRIRYLKQFSSWRTKQNELISAKIKDLSYQSQLLEQTKLEQETVLGQHKAAQSELSRQRVRQDALVTELKKNGKALESHLAKKQREANELKNRISALIAQEQQRAAEEERRRKAEAEKQRKAEEARKAAEARKAEEQRQQEEARRQAEAKARDDAAKKQNESKKEEKSAKDNKKTGSDGKDYAGARKRSPRNDQAPVKTPSQPSKPAPSPAPAATTGNFASAKGSLPYPVSGQFRVTSRFGRHPLPSLPNVEYDNPGIDAETSAGNSAVAVYGGKVSGVYVLPGYSTVVIVNHGSYYTVYGNISTPSVKVGDVVKQGQALGRLAPDEDDPGHSSIHFEVWHNRDKLDPMQWLR